jgi:hypothetical protein
MKPALHRSIVFWSGLLVMGFILWAWRDSYRYNSSYILFRLSYSNAAGGVWLERDGISSAGWIGSRHVGPRVGLHAEPNLFQRPFFLRGQDQPRPLGEDGTIFSPSNHETKTSALCYYPSDLWVLSIPHWLILLTVAALWLGLLFWRARRRNKSVITP